jgi:hypothetical protein
LSSPGAPIRIIGIDCATRTEKNGLAAGWLDRGELRVESAVAATADLPLAEQVLRLLPAGPSEEPALLALDAPLGWPQAMGQLLGAHEAGRPLEVEADALFRRETDRMVRRLYGKTPLEVGADRIARTALAALKMIGELERRSGTRVPLAWNPTMPESPAAIEVYPAGTLRANRLNTAGYRVPEAAETRSGLLEELERIYRFSLTQAGRGLLSDPHAFDAFVCLLAAVDFLEGRATAPKEPQRLRREGWIWIRKPADP